MPPKARIFYTSLPDEMRKEEKLDWLKDKRFDTISFENIIPDKNNNWINLATENDWEDLLPLASKDVKSGKENRAVFKLFSLGVVTARDEWVYDFEENHLQDKVNFFFDFFKQEMERWGNSDKRTSIRDFIKRDVKFTSELEEYLAKGTDLTFDLYRIRNSSYRPFTKLFIYFDRIIIHRVYLQDKFFPIGNDKDNLLICINIGNKPFNVLISCCLPDYHFNGDSNCLPLFSYDSAGTRHDNITDWGLSQFREHYKDETITKEEIFHYTYAVLHNPEYRKKYELNLKREFPRLPFYDDFRRWAAWGKRLMELHIHYETVEPYDLKENTYEVKAEAKRQVEIFKEAKEPDELYTHVPKVKVKLKADKPAGIIEIDELTFLSGVPPKAWEYKLGNRSALEWILDQYKEKKPSDPTIAEKFNTYRFAGYKTKVIDLLKRVCTVSVETMGIVEEMRSLMCEV